MPSNNKTFLEKAQEFIASSNEKTIKSHDLNAEKFEIGEMPVQKAIQSIRESISGKNITKTIVGALTMATLNGTFNIAPSSANPEVKTLQPTLEQVIVTEAGKSESQVKGGGVRAGLEAVTKDDGKFSINEIAAFVEIRNKTNGFIDAKKDQADTAAILNKVNAGENIIQAASEVAFTSPEAKIQDGKNQAAGKVTEGQYYAEIVANAQKSILEKQNQKPTETKPTSKTSPQTPIDINIPKKVKDDLSFNTNISTPKNKNSLEIMASAAENVISTIDKAITPGANAAEVSDVQKIMSNDKLPTLSSKYDQMITPQIEKYTSENKALQVQLKKDLKTLNNSNGRYQSAKKMVDKSPSEGNKANLKVLENNARNQYAQVAKTLTQLENISSSAEAKSNLDDSLRSLYGAIGGAAAMATIWGIYGRTKKNKNKPDIQLKQPEKNEVEKEFIDNPNQYDKPIGPEEAQPLQPIIQPKGDNKAVPLRNSQINPDINNTEQMNPPKSKDTDDVEKEKLEKERVANEAKKAELAIVEKQRLAKESEEAEKTRIKDEQKKLDEEIKLEKERVANEAKKAELAIVEKQRLAKEAEKAEKIAREVPKKGVATKMEDGLMNLFPRLRAVKESLLQTQSEIIAKPILAQEQTQEVQKPETLKLKSLHEMTNNELADEVLKMGTVSEYDKKRIEIQLKEAFNNPEILEIKDLVNQALKFKKSLGINGHNSFDNVYEIFEIACDNLNKKAKPITINLDELRKQKPSQSEPTEQSPQKAEASPVIPAQEETETPPAPITPEQIQQQKLIAAINRIFNPNIPVENRTKALTTELALTDPTLINQLTKLFHQKQKALNNNPQ